MKAPYDRVKDLQVMFANAVLRKQFPGTAHKTIACMTSANCWILRLH